MKYRQLGHSGLVVSTVGVGCNNFGGRVDAAGTQRVVHAAIDLGINLFDTADIYGTGQSEEMLGLALRNRRDDVVIATKFAMPMGPGLNQQGGSRTYILRAIEGSLRRLGTDYVDLYQMHQPDPKTPIDETLAALDTLVQSGKVRYIGSSNFAGWQIAEAAATADSKRLTQFVSAQNEYSLLERSVESEVVPACLRFGVGILPFFPLASGMLTGKYSRSTAPPPDARLSNMPNADRFLNDANFDVVEGLQEFAAARGIKLLDLAIGGLAAQPAVVSVIAGATSPDQVVANVAAGEWEPTPEDLAHIDRLVPARR